MIKSMYKRLSHLHHASVSGKTVLLRADLDAPLSDETHKRVIDDTRLVVGLPTIEYLLHNKAKVIVVGHLRRPERIDSRFTLEPIAHWLCHKARIQAVTCRMPEHMMLGEFPGWKLDENLFLLENIRFYQEEKENDTVFAKKLAGLAEIYVNDAFASSHREHASIVGIPPLLPHYAGIHLEDEVRVLSTLLEKPEHPFVVIVGGAKTETKLPLINKMHELADTILVGGKIAKEGKVVLEQQFAKKETCELLVADLNEDESDLSLLSVQKFLQVIRGAKTIVWNGPVGKTEEGKRSEASEMLAKGILESNAYSVVGGGDTLEFLRRENLLHKFSFFSTGGGAMLAFLSGEKLPGIEALLA